MSDKTSHDLLTLATHEDLLKVFIKKPSDFEGYGQRYRDGPDCSCGCRFFQKLPGELDGDWGVCFNPASPRAGLLTFEHQGCPAFEDMPLAENKL